MAKTFISASISTGNTIEAGHVTQSSDAFTGTEAYDIIISGSLTTTGTNIMSSSASPSITSILTENDSHPFITAVDTTGPNFRMNLVDADSSGSAYMAFGRQSGPFTGTGFTAHYATGSNASEGEIIMSIGKNGDVNTGIHDRFIVQSEPGPIASNAFSELSLLAGTHSGNRRVVQMVVQNGTGDFADFTVGNQDIATGYKKHVLLAHSFNNTSSLAGFASSSLNTGSTSRNFNANSIPFGIVAGGFTTAEEIDTVFFVDGGGSLGSTRPVTASFEISRGGSINMEGSITASSNISSSGDIIGNNGSFSTSVTTPEISGNTEITGDLQVINIAATHITASGTGLFQAGKPIKTHTTSPISASLANAGFYHIVGGDLTCSISTSTAPIGAEYEFFQTASAGNFLFETGSGVTLISKNDSLRLAQLGSSAVLKKVGTSTFHLMGDLT